MPLANLNQNMIVEETKQNTLFLNNDVDQDQNNSKFFNEKKLIQCPSSSASVAMVHHHPSELM